MHRFVWDLRYARPAALEFDYPIAAVYENTVAVPEGVWANPGSYRVRLIVDGKTFVQPLTVKMDPRVKTPWAGLTQQFTLSMQVDSMLRANVAGVEKARAASQNDRVQALTRLNGELTNLFNALQQADAAPTTQLVAAVRDRAAALQQALK
jgi:hypothetical protein